MNHFLTLLNSSHYSFVFGGNESKYDDKLRFVNLKNEHAFLSIVYFPDNQVVYEASLKVFKTEQVFRWINPNYLKSYKDFYYKNNLDPRFTLDGLKCIDCEIFDDFNSKVVDVFNKGFCDSMVSIPLDFIDDEIKNLFEKLKEKNIEINEFIENVLKKESDKFIESMNDYWLMLTDLAKKDNITLSKEKKSQNILFLINKNKITDIYKWIKSLNTSSVSVIYSDKEKIDGIECTLKALNGDNEFSSFTYCLV